MEKITEMYFDSLKILFKAPDFKKSIDNFYISKISEFESRKNQSNFKEYLNNQHKEISQTFFQNKRLSKLHPKLSNEIEFVCVTMESLLHQIDVELSRLQQENSKSNPNTAGSKESAENDNLAYNNEVDNALKKIELILNDINSLLFENSNLNQWEQILKLQTPKTPIITKGKISLKDIVYLFEKLCIYEIFRYQYKADLVKVKAFKVKGKFIANPRQLTTALTECRKTPPAISKELDEIFTKFKVQA